MSLFKARSWWNTNVSEDETESFDRNSLLIARLTEGDHDNLVVGSHLGALRVYKVTTKRLDDGSLSAYKPTDLVLEKLLPYPVLGLGLGKLVSYVDSLRSVLFALNSLLFSLHSLVLKGISKMVLMCTASTTSYCIFFEIIRRDHRPWTMSENNLTLAEIARCFRLEESELASLLVSADNAVAESELASLLVSADNAVAERELASMLQSADNAVAERELASMLQSADILPPELSNHKLEKEYFITGISIEDLFMKQNEVVNFIKLQRKFTEICPDYADELNPNTESKALEFASTVILKVGPASRKMKKVGDTDTWKFRFSCEGDKKKKIAFVCRNNSNTLQHTFTSNLNIILSVKQASLLALCTLNKLTEFAYNTENKIMLTPMVRSLFSEDDIPKMASDLNANVTDVIKTINCSAQAGGHVLIESELHCSILCYLVFTKNVKDKKVKLGEIGKMINKYLAAGKSFSKNKFKVYCKYSTHVIAEQLTYELLNKLPNNLKDDITN